MAWYDGGWPVAAALIAGAVALYQFSQARESRRASEIFQLEQAMTSAKARDDPIYHSYRAHSIGRMQSILVHPQQAGGRAFFQVSFAGLFFLMLLVSVAATWWWQLAMLAGCFSMLYLAASNLNLWRYGRRMLEEETLEAHEHHLALARQAFMAAPREADPRLPTPSLSKNVKEKAAQSWEKRRTDYIKLAAIMAVGGLGVAVARYGFLQGWFSGREGLEYTSYAVIGGALGMLFGSRTGWRQLSWINQTWVRAISYVGLHVLVVIGALKYGPPWVQDRLLAVIRDNNPPMKFEAIALLLSVVGVASIGYGVFFVTMRIMRLVKNRPKTPNQPMQPPTALG